MGVGGAKGYRGMYSQTLLGTKILGCAVEKNRAFPLYISFVSLAMGNTRDITVDGNSFNEVTE